MGGEGGAAGQVGVRAFAFAEPEAARWGVGWLPAQDPGLAVLQAGGQPASGSVELSGQGPREPWQLKGPGADLLLEGVSEPADGGSEETEGSFDQLCRVTGKLDGPGGPAQIEALGWRAVRPPGLERGAGSFRLAVAWFEAEDGFALIALRPSKAKGPDEDEVTGALFERGAARLVADPRLSTTYAESGQPIRAGVELWLETEADSDHLYPRRAIGQALAPRVTWTAGGTALETQPFRWFSGSREGPGVYLLGQW